MLYSLDLLQPIEIGGIKKTHELVADGDIHGNNLPQLFHGGLFSGDFRQQSQEINLHRRKFSDFDLFWLAKKIALKIGETHFVGFLKILYGFNFFCQQFDLVILQPVERPGDGVQRSQPDINFYDLGTFDEWFKLSIIDKIIKSKCIAFLFEILAYSNQFIRGLDIFEDFNNDLILGKCGRQISLEQVLGEVDETGSQSRYLINAPGQEGGGQKTCGCPIAAHVGKRIRLRPPIEEFVTIKSLMDVENRLPGYILVHKNYLSLSRPV